jgi:hypothetical protein
MSIYRTGSLKTVARELEKYSIDPMAAQEFRWVGLRVVVNQQIIRFSMEMEMLII